jgi:hypothetical protein
MWSAATPKGEWIFGGVIDKIEFSENPDMITLHCLDDAIELERQYDDTYGRVEGTYTCGYGNTDDFDGQIAALLATGWTRTTPTNGIHDKLIYAAGTRRLDAINQTIDQTPMLGFYVLPMKHLACTSGDLISNPDAYTEDKTLWTADANTSIGDAALGGLGIHGTKIIRFGRKVGTGNGAFSGWKPNLDLGPVQICNLALYYSREDSSVTSLVIRIHTQAGVDYWDYSLPTPNTVDWASFASYLHLNIHLPDANGTHGWTATGSPSVNSNIVRIEIRGTSNEGKNADLDVLFLYTRKKQTSKYTVSNIMQVSRSGYVGYNKVSIASSATGSPHTVEDVTRETLHGTREMTYVDKQITEDSLATYTASGILAAESEAEENEGIDVTVINPGDMYNLMLGDTITITAANLNLSSATRILYERRDTLDQNGWITTLRTGTSQDMLRHTYRALKTKHF